MVESQDDLIQKGLKSIYAWAKDKGYSPVYKPNSTKPTTVSAMKGETLLKVDVKNGNIVMATMPKDVNLESEVAQLLGINDFEDPPVDLSGKPEVEEVDVKEIEPEKEILPEPVREKPKPAPRREPQKHAPVKREYSDARRDLDIVRSQKDGVYEVSGRKALTADRLSELINEAGLNTQVMDIGRDENKVWATVRVINPRTGRYREDAKVIDRAIFWTLKSSEIAINQQKKLKNTNLILGWKSDGMPELNNDIILNGTPAGLWLYMQVLRSWSTADGFALTRATSRAAQQMLNQEWRDEDEISTEKNEAAAIQEMK